MFCGWVVKELPVPWMIFSYKLASSGAGNADHFLEVFTRTKAEAALAAGIFHRNEVPIGEVKEYLKDKVEIRPA